VQRDDRRGHPRRERSDSFGPASETKEMMAMRSKVLFTTLVSGVVLCTSAANADQVASGNNFTVNATAAACTSNADCKIDLRLEAKGDFHVNKEYPYKFKATAANGVTFLGKDGAGVDTFSKSAGDFTLDASNEKVGTMTIK